MISGTYEVSIKLGGDHIKDSPWPGIIVSPGEIAPYNSLHTLPAPASDIQMTAGITLFFNLELHDIYDNLIPDHRENAEVTILATYIDHDDWLSPIESTVPDLDDW